MGYFMGVYMYLTVNEKQQFHASFVRIILRWVYVAAIKKNSLLTKSTNSIKKHQAEGTVRGRQANMLYLNWKYGPSII